MKIMEKFTFIHYPLCGTCRKARKWLDENGIACDSRLIVEERPTEEELRIWIPKSGLPVKKFFNTSGVRYKEMNLKEKLAGMSEDEQIQLLATDGKLVKRPLMVSGHTVLVGFKEEQWKAALL